MGTLLSELASREILTGITVKRLREYISTKYPQLSPALKAGIFADAVNRIVAGKLPELPEDRVSLFKALLYGDAAKKQVFSIDCSDVFKSSLKLKITEESFIKELKIWLEEALLTPVSEDKVSEYVYNACSILSDNPEMDIEKVLDSVENKVGDIRPKKRVISVIRIKPASSAIETGTQKDNKWEATESVTAQTSGTASYEGNAPAALDKKDAGKENAGKENVDRESIGRGKVSGDWIVVKRRQSAGEMSTGKLSLLASSVAGIYRRASGFTEKVFSIRSGYRTAVTAALVAVVLLCTFLSALYVNAVNKAKPAKADEALKVEDVSTGFEYMGLKLEEDGNVTKESDEISGEVLEMRATAYDLSVESCGKDREHPEYGITYSGTRAEAGRTVAVDPMVIPLGSSIRITFPEEYSYMDGIYVAEDTGRLIKGNNIDIFFGEDKGGSKVINKKALQFGVQYVEVEIIDNKQAFR